MGAMGAMMRLLIALIAPIASSLSSPLLGHHMLVELNRLTRDALPAEVLLDARALCAPWSQAKKEKEEVHA
jgi:hypothetical protein